MEYTAMSLVLSLILAIVGGKIHQNKGYSFIAGFLWVAFLGLLGLLIVALTKPKVSVETNKENKMYDENTPIQ
ncbi:MAG: hypothetical protein IJX99_01665 [Clostridia bacterium]|nr:hypothetical protein [Clostridia bacterium]